MMRPGDMIGRVLNGYRLERSLGSGTFGTVYLARHTDLDRLRAIKVAREARFVELVRAEGRLLDALRHPNVVRLYEMDTTADPAYVILEYVPGGDLRRALRDGPMAPQDVLELALRLLEGLSAAHGLGILHRDIKPSNILLGEGGLVKLADFGLGQVAAQESLLVSGTSGSYGASQLRQSQGSTDGEHSGAVVGTIAYMSPEQRRGDALDPRSDLYSLGAVLYEALTHRLPEGRFKLPGELLPGVPPDLDGLLDVLLAPDPDSRPDSAQTARELLSGAAKPPRQTEQQPEERKRQEAERRRRQEAESGKQQQAEDQHLQEASGARTQHEPDARPAEVRERQEAEEQQKRQIAAGWAHREAAAQKALEAAHSRRKRETTNTRASRDHGSEDASARQEAEAERQREVAARKRQEAREKKQQEAREQRKAEEKKRQKAEERKRQRARDREQQEAQEKKQRQAQGKPNNQPPTAPAGRLTQQLREEATARRRQRAKEKKQRQAEEQRHKDADAASLRRGVAGVAIGIVLLAAIPILATRDARTPPKPSSVSRRRADVVPPRLPPEAIPSLQAYMSKYGERKSRSPGSTADAETSTDDQTTHVRLAPGSRAGEETAGPDGGVYVWVPPGEFMMGSGDGDPDEKPVHKMRITKGFWLAKHEVTNAQYRAFCEATGKAFPKDSDQGDDHPVVYVSWRDARAYCDHYGLALPTEAQWEYAARGPEGHEYPWGDEWDRKKCCNRDNQGPGGRTFPVGSFSLGASWCGALDMAGNVQEWCSDRYDESYYANSPEPDPMGPVTGFSRVLRGGSWSIYDDDRRSANRDFNSPDYTNYGGLGFRCARTP